MTELTQARLRELLDYDPETGAFTWRTTGTGRRRDLRAGGILKCRGGPYLHIQIGGHKYLAHRLAFLTMTGRFPPDDVDHRDGDGLNNRWANLRAATASQNLANRGAQANNTSGFKGVIWAKREHRWLARITVCGKQHQIGSFNTPEEAHSAYRAAAGKHFGQFARIA